MARNKQIPDNTEFFEYTPANPKNTVSCDCAIRAIALAEGRTWEDVVYDMTKFAMKSGHLLVDNGIHGKYLESRGYVKMPMLTVRYGKKATAEQLCSYLRNHDNPTAIVNMGGYVTLIKDGKIRDVVNVSHRCTGNYWVFKNPLY